VIELNAYEYTVLSLLLSNGPLMRFARPLFDKCSIYGETQLLNIFLSGREELLCLPVRGSLVIKAGALNT
jgi:hypothetical protein